MSATKPEVGEVWRNDESGNCLVCTPTIAAALTKHGPITISTGGPGWTRVLCADGSVPPEVRRAIRIETACRALHERPGQPVIQAEIDSAELFVDARWPEDAT